MFWCPTILHILWPHNERNSSAASSKVSLVSALSSQPDSSVSFLLFPSPPDHPSPQNSLIFTSVPQPSTRGPGSFAQRKAEGLLSTQSTFGPHQSFSEGWKLGTSPRQFPEAELRSEKHRFSFSLAGISASALPFASWLGVHLVLSCRDLKTFQWIRGKVTKSAAHYYCELPGNSDWSHNWVTAVGKARHSLLRWEYMCSSAMEEPQRLSGFFI